MTPNTKYKIQNTIRLSVAMATFNEESNLKYCLESVKGLADEIVVVDGSSTDKTVEIAQSFGAKVIVTDNKPIFHINKEQAIEECRGEWIFQLDADEQVTPELAEEIKSIITPVTNHQSLITNHQSPTTNHQSLITNDGYWIKRKKMFLGRWIKKGGQYPDPVIRLFKNGKGHLPCKSVHEQVVIEGEVGWLKNELIHLPTPSFATYLTKDNRYSTLTALEMEEKDIPINFWNFLKYIIWEPHRIFFDLYILHKGFLDGFPGFVFAFYSGLHQTSAFIKYWEMKTSGKKEI